ncbi:RnfABCDGE type electron transport complex subunit D [Candidatus Omnitrophota bacterium]
MKDKLIVSVSPHLSAPDETPKIMWLVSLSLIPAGLASVFIFGLASLWIVLACVLCAVATEAVIQKLCGKAVTIYDGSAALTGLLLGYCLPPRVPLWMAAVGAIVAIAIGKQVFGGLGQNIFNPALVGRAFIMVAWPTQMTTWIKPGLAWQFDAVSSATPLANNFVQTSLWELLIGNRGGSIGEVCVLALLIGGLFLLITGLISWQIPAVFLATVGLLTWVFAGENYFSGAWLQHILSGGLILGAFFMATDYVTSPLTHKGKLIFGFGCGLFTAIIRIWGGYPEGTCYAILLMNAATPMIDRYTPPKKFGTC